MFNLKNVFTTMKKIMTLAVIALTAVAMVACSGQPKKKLGACGEPCCQPKVECAECPNKVECPKKAKCSETACPEAKCAECPKKAECTKKAECPEAKCAECPKKAECTKKAECPTKSECPKKAACQHAK